MSRPGPHDWSAASPTPQNRRPYRPYPDQTGLCCDPLVNASGPVPPGEEASLLPTSLNRCSPTTPHRAAPPGRQVLPPSGLTWESLIPDLRLRVIRRPPRFSVCPPHPSNGMPSFSRDSRPQLTLSSRAGGVERLQHDNASTATTVCARDVYARQPMTLRQGPTSALVLALALALVRTHGVRD